MKSLVSGATRARSLTFARPLTAAGLAYPPADRGELMDPLTKRNRYVI